MHTGPGRRGVEQGPNARGAEVARLSLWACGQPGPGHAPAREATAYVFDTSVYSALGWGPIKLSAR